MMAMSDIRATVRLQFHRGFTLDEAAEWVGYYARLVDVFVQS